MSSDLEKQVDLENENAEIETNYQPPPQKSIEEIIAADQEDESLRKYKEALLGAAQTEKIIVGELHSSIAHLIKKRSNNFHFLFFVHIFPQMQTIREK